MREQLSGPRPIDGQRYELDSALETDASRHNVDYANSHPHHQSPYPLDENEHYHVPAPKRYQPRNAPAPTKTLGHYVKLQITGWRNGQRLQPQDTVVIQSVIDTNNSYTFQYDQYQWIPEVDATMIREKYICRIEHE